MSIDSKDNYRDIEMNSSRRIKIFYYNSENIIDKLIIVVFYQQSYFNEDKDIQIIPSEQFSISLQRQNDDNKY